VHDAVADLMYATQAGAQHRGLLRDLLILRTEDSQRWQATIPLPAHDLAGATCNRYVIVRRERERLRRSGAIDISASHFRLKLATENYTLILLFSPSQSLPF
jgi:hypothetical protein